MQQFFDNKLNWIIDSEYKVIDVKALVKISKKKKHLHAILKNTSKKHMVK